MFDSDGFMRDNDYCVCHVVSLKSNVIDIDVGFDNIAKTKSSKLGSK